MYNTHKQIRQKFAFFYSPPPTLNALIPRHRGWYFRTELPVSPLFFWPPPLRRPRNSPVPPTKKKTCLGRHALLLRTPTVPPPAVAKKVFSNRISYIISIWNIFPHIYPHPLPTDMLLTIGEKNIARFRERYAFFELLHPPIPPPLHVPFRPSHSEEFLD